MRNREFFIDDAGVRIHAKLDFPGENGRKEKYPLLILIHGLTGHMEEDHIRAAARAGNEAGFAVLRAEMYGHGGSGGAFRDHTVLKWIGNLMAVIDYAFTLYFVSGLYLCGHSQGGMVTMLVGAMEQDRIRAIIPLSPAWMVPEVTRKGELLGAHFDPDHVPDEIDIGNGLLLGCNYVRTAQLIDVYPAIRRFTKPVLLVHGSGDLAVPVHYSEEAASLYADARLVILPNDSHCYDLHVDMMADAVRTFLEENDHAGL